MCGRFMLRALLTGVLIVVLAGCSRVKFVYHQLDWLLPYYLGDYVSLTPEQALRLDEEMVQLRRWHCGTQLRDYAEWLRTAGSELESGAVDAVRIEVRYNQLTQFWSGLMAQASEHMARLIPQASEQQVTELLDNVAAENEKLRSDIERRSPAQRRQRSIDRMEEHLERWIGDLTPAQHEAVVDWSAGMAGGDADRLAGRESWQGEFRRLLQQRQTSAAFRDGLRQLFTDAPRFRAPEINARRAQRREATFRLLADIAGTLTSTQRAHAVRRALAWASDFEELACVDRPAGTARTTEFTAAWEVL